MIAQRTTETLLRELPDGWSFDRMKDVVSLRNNKITVQDEREDYLELEDISSGTGKLLSKRNTLDVASAVTTFERGDVLFGKLRPYLEKYYLAEFDGKCTGEILAFKPDRITGEYLRYCIASSWFIEKCNTLAYGAKMPRVNWPKQLATFDLPLPPADEQRRIAAYLDNACKAIDGAIEAKRKQLDTLAGLRKSIIHKAVTRGLDDSVEMKPSGVDWLGEIPAHWDVSRVKRNCQLLRGKFSHRPRNDPALYDGDYPFIQTGDIAAADKRIRSFSQTLNDQGLSVSRMFPKGTLVMAIAANIGDVAIMDFEACFPDSIVGFVPNHRVNLDYLYYLLGSMKQVFLRSAVLTTQLNINYVRIGMNFAPLPPEPEQRAIAENLDASCRDLATLRAKLTEQIQTLHDYRKSLLHECVTGKRRITDVDIQKVKEHV